MDNEARKEKISRIRAGGKLRVLDLFAGCGGLSLGFHREGFEISAALELDGLAAKSHAENFIRHSCDELRTLHGRPRDIVKTEPEELISEFRLGSPAQAIDIVIGGPPCQAFARVGRAKLREIAAHPEAFRQDKRANLYLRYLHYVDVLQPIAILMENVPDVLNYGGHNIPEEVCDALTGMGYRSKYTMLNSAYYGVPQMRERMFLLAYTNELNIDVAFPEPSRWINLPRGYEGSRKVALKGVNSDLFTEKAQYFSAPPRATDDLPAAVSAEEALGDLPQITVHLEGKLKRGARRFTELAEYRRDIPASGYFALMRKWPGFESFNGVYDHVIRSLPRDYPIFRRMRPGDQYPEAHQHARALLEERIAELASQGTPIESTSEAYRKLEASIVPPYDATKFPNKWRKMESNLPARTLMAHLGKDGYSHIHYSSEQARTISVREAARLQSFPDGFTFEGTMNPAFRQIGNAVPPLLAAAIASKIKEEIETGIGLDPNVNDQLLAS